MKKEFMCKPEKVNEVWPGELELFSWQDFVTAMLSPLVVVTTYKVNGKENACLSSRTNFVGDQGEFI